MSTVMMIVNAVLIIAFAVASYTDIKNRKIPMWLFPTAMVICTAVRIIGGEYNFLYMGLGFILYFFLFFIAAIFAKGGGGDAIMMACVGATIYPLDTAYLFILSGVAYMLFGIVLVIVRKSNKKLRRMTFPYAPFAGIGFVALNVIQLI